MARNFIYLETNEALEKLKDAIDSFERYDKNLRIQTRPRLEARAKALEAVGLKVEFMPVFWEGFEKKS